MPCGVGLERLEVEDRRRRGELRLRRRGERQRGEQRYGERPHLQVSSFDAVPATMQRV